MTLIHHGTPMTPRDALVSVCTGRAMCVSFYRPDDVEAVEAISPAIMFRQRGVLVLAASLTSREGVGRASRLGTILRVVGTEAVQAGPLGRHSGQPWGTVPAQRCAAERMAVRAEGCAVVAHGWPDRTAVAAVRAIRPRLPRVDRAKGGVAGLSRSHGRSGSGFGQSLAGSAHDARDRGGLRLPIRQRGLDITRTERVAI